MNQPLLRAVVDVALQSPTGVVGGGDDARPRGDELRVAIATAARSANCARRASVSAGSGGPAVLATSAARMRPSTAIGTAVVEAMPNSRVTSASVVAS